MTTDQILVFAILVAALVLFAWGRWRHDIVAVAALLAAVASGLVPAGEAFAGFGHPAVVTVAAVLVLSQALQNSGAVDLLAQRVLPMGAPPLALLAGLTGLTALLSGFMNNVGALAMMMPVGLHAAARAGWPPGRVLMPLAFGAILGGMMTLIGTPPNLIVSAFRDETIGGGFRMFEFAPVGVPVAVAGVAFIALFGWRLIPARNRAGVEGFDAGAYMTEARVTEGSTIVGQSLRDLEQRLDEADAQIVGLVRRQVRLRAPRGDTTVLAGDILMIEAEPTGLASALAALGIKLEEDVEPERSGEPDPDSEEENAHPPRSEDGEVALSELVVSPGAALIGRTPKDISLRTRYRVNLLALSRQGQRSVRRLRSLRFAPGDVLLMQGAPEAIAAFASDQGCLPLAERPLRLPDRRRMALAVGIFVGAVLVAASGLTTAAVALTGGVLLSVLTRTVPPRGLYAAVDWPVIVLLAALLPVAEAMEATGGAELLARSVVGATAGGAPVVALTGVLVLTMLLSAVMNNAATVAVLAPVAVGTAAAIGSNPDAFLMAVAIGGSCAFLTPIAHQNNTLILGPGGFRFGDYWRLGLPLTAVVIGTAVPMIAVVWGL